MITALLFCLSLSGAFDISLAPDQPMPFIYVDDPLIIEFSSDTDAEVEGRLLFRAAADGAETECRLDKMLVRGGTEYWYAVHNAPENRGLFYLNAELTVNGEAMQFERRYCRIDRPAALTSLPIYAHCGGEENTCPVVALRMSESIRCGWKRITPLCLLLRSAPLRKRCICFLLFPHPAWLKHWRASNR